ncbi:MAG: hypothetical protein ACJAVM_002081 [Sulfitobacter sp.]|jgi:uncharacterized protein
MPDIAKTAADMISDMAPALQAGRFVFVTTTDSEQGATLTRAALACFRESEGLSLLVPLDLAQSAGFAVDHPMRQITLTVYSALDGVGLTAAVSQALAARNIPCNMIAAYHHDHVFVPEDCCDAALEVLLSLQGNAPA